MFQQDVRIPFLSALQNNYIHIIQDFIKRNCLFKSSNFESFLIIIIIIIIITIITKSYIRKTGGQTRKTSSCKIRGDGGKKY